ncbi:hypothetical protein BV898_05499 [Hypsibius exemplaris]|uniref:C3H1-type domain-containing protein n=1 Tax=Hypsibius exemplaris TaxID=2072580 RepID=A0A1W0WZ20_HYPEX|nr:hypothetical protein BV898_05499 [Hypsibius exemplaris]
MVGGFAGGGGEHLKRKPVEDPLNSGSGKRLKEAADESFFQNGPPLSPSHDSNAQQDDNSDFPGLLGEPRNTLDQTEVDELSTIDWSQGRRRGPSGLLTCVLDRRRQREQLQNGGAAAGGAAAVARKKKVRFVSEEKLVKIQTFELDETERQNVYRTGQAVTGIDIKKSDSQSERKSLEHAQYEDHAAEVVDEHPWYTPPALSGLPPPLIVPGKDSVERLALSASTARHSLSGSLTTFHNREDLPDCPEEPADSLVVKGSVPEHCKLIPLLRPGMNLSQPLMLAPRGPLRDPPMVGGLPPVSPQPQQQQPPFQFTGVINGPSERETGGVSLTPGVGSTTTTKTADAPTVAPDFAVRLAKALAVNNSTRIDGPPTIAANSDAHHYSPPPVFQGNPGINGTPAYSAIRPEYYPTQQYGGPPPIQQYPPHMQQRPPWHHSSSGGDHPPRGPRPSYPPNSYSTANTVFEARGNFPQVRRNSSGIRMCSYFNLPKGCRNGANCTFSHER